MERRPKGLNSKQERELDILKKTFPRYEFTDLLILARLRLPKEFPYAKPHRLYNDVSKKIIQSWKDIGDFFHYLPESYRKEIISSLAFESLFRSQILNTLQQEVQRKRRQKKYKSANISEKTLFELYSTFFQIGYYGLTNLMPSDFRNYLDSQIKPTLSLMRSILSYTESLSSKKSSLKQYGFKSQEIGV